MEENKTKDTTQEHDQRQSQAMPNGQNSGKQPQVRSVKGYLVFLEDHLGKGQYGQVCKAKLSAEVKLKTSKTYACKIMEVANIAKEDLDAIQKEVQIHNMIKSEYCVRLHHSIKTQSNIYMMQDYCNGFDLAVLLKLRKTITQLEVSQILRQVVLGCKDIWELSIIHRDIKLANILLHFPENPEVDTMNKQEKYQFLKNFDLASGDFKAYISDFGLSTIVYEGNNSQLSICGTPLYSSPQLLKKKGYSYKVDIWAIGIMCYELLMGRTPFHSYEMKDLIYKINKGDYTVSLNEPVSVECALFLSSCLQANENDRVDVQDLVNHPFLNLNNSIQGKSRLTQIDKLAYSDEMIKYFELQQATEGSRVSKQFAGSILSTREQTNSVDNNTLLLNTQEKVQMIVLSQQLKSSTLIQQESTTDMEFNSSSTQVDVVQKIHTDIVKSNQIESGAENSSLPQVSVENEQFDQEALDHFRALERQYQGSQYQKQQEIIEIETKPNRQVSITNSDQVASEMKRPGAQVAEKPGAFSRFANFISNKLCGGGQEERKTDGKTETINVKPPMQPKSELEQRSTNEEKMRLMQIKEEREKELRGKNENDFQLL